MSPRRTSPVARALGRLNPKWRIHRGMAIATRIGDADELLAASAGVCDLSALTRTGLKGPGAAAWLAAHGVPVPAEPNAWVPLPGGGLIARLARTEFLIEDDLDGDLAPRLAAELRAGLEGVTPVRRQDCALALLGERIGELLVQACNVDFAAQDPAARIVTLTLMVGVSVTVLRRDAGRHACHRIWCDATSGPYLWETLSGIAEELGGGPVGASVLLAPFPTS